VESPRPREAAEILAAIKGRDARTAPARTLRRGTPESKQHRVASSSAPAFTLTAKARTAYHFIAFSAEACGTWRLYHGAAGMDAAAGAKERILALATPLSASGFCPASLLPLLRLIPSATSLKIGSELNL
jgi:hypothetical protein